MKNAMGLAAILILLTVGCKQERRTDIDVEAGDGTTVTETETTTVPTIDPTVTAEASDAASDAAHETGTALEEAGRELQENTRTDTR